MNILKNRFINTTAMFLAPPDKPKEGEEDNRSDAQKERDGITISDSTDNEDNDKNKEDNENGEEDEEAEKEEDDEDDEDNKKEDEVDKNKEETEEEKTARLASEKEERKQARQQRKWDKLAAEKTAAENEVKKLKKQLEEKPVDGLTEEEVVRRAEELANTKLTEKQIQDAKKAFEKNCDKLEDAATKEDKDFGRKVNELTSELGPIPAPIINVLADLDHENGGEVLAYLANNVDEAEEIYELVGNDRKLDRRLSKLSDKLKEAKKAPRRERSSVPAPITPIGEGNRRESLNTNITGKETQEEFNAKRAKQEAARREARGY